MAKEKTDKKEATKSEATPAQDAVPPQGGAAPAGFTVKEEGAFSTRADYFAGSFAITEALLAFGRIHRDGSRQIDIGAKITVSVRDAKRVFLTLQQLVRQYEDKYGEIKI